MMFKMSFWIDMGIYLRAGYKSLDIALVKQVIIRLGVLPIAQSKWQGAY